MTDPETRLAAALSADAPPAHDPMFRVEVLVRLERERFRREVLRALLGLTIVPALRTMVARAYDRWLSPQ
jgi:hypothetical protein